MPGQPSSVSTAQAPRSFQVTATADAGGAEGMASATVRVIDFGLVLSATEATFARAASAELTVTVTPVGDAFGEAVGLTCPGAQRVSCAFAPAAMTPGTGPATSTLTVSAVAAAAAVPVTPAPRLHPPGWLAVLGALLLGSRLVADGTRRRCVRGFAAAAAAALLVSACRGDPTAPPEPFEETVQVTATSGTLVESVSVTVRVE